MQATLFALFSSIAAFIYIGAAVTLGSVFRHEVDGVISAISHYGKLGGLFSVVLFGLYLLLKWLRRYRLIRQFETDRVTVNDLINLMDGEYSPVILDARPMDQRTKNGFIPGSVPIDENSLNDIAGQYAQHEEIIIYCSCPNEITAARYAEKLRKVGLKRIRPLIGGIDAWAESGRKVIFDM